MSVPGCWAKPLDLADHLTGKVRRPVPSLLRRSDGEALLYTGKVNELHGEPEAGKGFIIAQAAGEVIGAGRPVLYLDFDNDPDSLAMRLLASGADPEAIQRLARYYPISEPLSMTRTDRVRAWTEDSAALLEEMCGPEVPGIVVLDNVNAAMAMHGLDPVSTPDTAEFARLLVRPFRSPDTSVNLLDHVTKDSARRGRWAIGAMQKSAGLDGVSYEVRVKEVPAPGKVGRLLMVVSKDRHGGVRKISRRGKEDVAAEVTIDGTGPTPTVSIDPPGDPADFRPTALMERVSQWLELANGPQSQRAIRQNVVGNNTYIQVAIGCLVSEGYLATERGARGAILHRVLQAFREDRS